MMWTTTMVYSSWMTQPTMINPPTTTMTTAAPDIGDGNLQAPVRTRVNFAESFLWGEITAGPVRLKVSTSYANFKEPTRTRVHFVKYWLWETTQPMSLDKFNKRCFASSLNLISGSILGDLLQPVTQEETNNKGEPLQEPAKTRSNFVETWLWDSLDVG
ncbi:hypothetical protein Btru_057006 [Bulinus truncatus]|nr:hypothetical protein Btru_057006 [Bulinus truncatus]